MITSISIYVNNVNNEYAVCLPVHRETYFDCRGKSQDAMAHTMSD